MSHGRIMVSRTFCMPTGMYGVSLRRPSQQLFFTRLDEKFMPALATGLTASVDWGRSSATPSCLHPGRQLLWCFISPRILKEHLLRIMLCLFKEDVNGFESIVWDSRPPCLNPWKISYCVVILSNIFAVRFSCKLPFLIWRSLIAIIDTPQLLWYFFLTPKGRLSFLFSTLFF